MGGPTEIPAATAKGETSTVELTRTQQTIARRMAESRATIPDFTVAMDVDMSKALAMRAELGPATVNDLVIKAAAMALRDHPRANASYRDGHLQLHSRVNIGMAVAANDDELAMPTVFDADERSLQEIAGETRALAERVRAGTITPPELSGATFTISNLGSYGVRSFTAIISPPQAAILAVGSIESHPLTAIDSSGSSHEPTVGHTMTLTLTCDHRILFGAGAARFLGRIRELLEGPATLTL